MYFQTIFCLLACTSIAAFRFSSISNRMSAITRRNMADDAAMDEIRAKMEADPNYNPMTDPKAQQAIESLIPQELKDIGNAIARLKVAFKDATTGADAPSLDDLDKIAADLGTKDMISSPQSQWMKSGLSDEGLTDDTEELKRLRAELSKEFPEVPVRKD